MESWPPDHDPEFVHKLDAQPASDFIPASDTEFERVIALLERDVMSSLSETHRHAVRASAENARSFAGADSFAQKVADDVQQYFMDTFVDTTWPACPRHPSHPLWLIDGSWRCQRDQVALAPLGELSSIPRE